ncbi:protein kinase domain-containing protein [Cryptosporidium felis]|nr:protein kinase domain-containing protein [Cryptosporidium felis]
MSGESQNSFLGVEEKFDFDFNPDLWKNSEAPNWKNKNRLKEIFGVGKSIEIVYKHETSNKSQPERLVEFLISKVLGMGSHGIVVLATVTHSSSLLEKEKRDSVTVEISDLNIRHLFEGMDPERKDSRTNLNPGPKKKFTNLQNQLKSLAIKIIDLESNDSPELEDPVLLARKEISIMSELQDCEQVLKYYVTFTVGPFLYILMEYAEGGSLYNIYSRFGCFPEELIASTIGDVLRGLVRLHGEGRFDSQVIIHNDIKSANILLTNNCVAKLADFGVSKKTILRSNQNRPSVDSTYSHSQNDHELLGSPFWMAPEIIIGSSCSTASDIWSLGITCLELAFGKIPWPSFDSLESLLNHVLTFPPPHKTVRQEIISLFSPEFWEFVDSCLQVDPNFRKSAKNLLAHPFLQRAKRPSSIDIFFKTVSGGQILKSNYFQDFLNYVNLFFGQESLGMNQSLVNKNLQKTKSISISRYFTRKKSSLARKTSLNRLFLQNQGNTINIKIEEELTPDERERKKQDLFLPVSTFESGTEGNNFLEKRISAKSLQKCIEFPSIDLGSPKTNNSKKESILVPQNSRREVGIPSSSHEWEEGFPNKTQNLASRFKSTKLLDLENEQENHFKKGVQEEIEKVTKKKGRKNYNSNQKTGISDPGEKTRRSKNFCCHVFQVL